MATVSEPTEETKIILAAASCIEDLLSCQQPQGIAPTRNNAARVIVRELRSIAARAPDALTLSDIVRNKLPFITSSDAETLLMLALLTPIGNQLSVDSSMELLNKLDRIRNAKIEQHTKE